MALNIFAQGPSLLVFQVSTARIKIDYGTDRDHLKSLGGKNLKCTIF